MNPNRVIASRVQRIPESATMKIADMAAKLRSEG